MARVSPHHPAMEKAAAAPRCLHTLEAGSRQCAEGLAPNLVLRSGCLLSPMYLRTTGTQLRSEIQGPGGLGLGKEGRQGVSFADLIPESAEIYLVTVGTSCRLLGPVSLFVSCGKSCLSHLESSGYSCVQVAGMGSGRGRGAEAGCLALRPRPRARLLPR